MATSLTPFTGASRLRQLLADKDSIVVCPGVFDGLTARIALNSGFKAIYMVSQTSLRLDPSTISPPSQTGAGTSMSRLGWADLGLATQNDMHANAAMIASLNPSIPLIADADTGYGGPIMVSRTVAQYARAGVAALHIEDQVQEKRCGHLMGKEIVARDVFASRIRAAVAARDQLGSEMLIIARSDARQSAGFDETYERLRMAAELGADMVFFEALQSADEARRICELMGDVPVLLNMVPGGTTPSFSVEEAKDLGFRMIIFPGACLAPIVNSVQKELQHLAEKGTVSDANPADGVKKLFMLCGLQECMDIDKAALGKAYSSI
jgi:2-methylisocitrate lyase-like PEP mutase family enzyme